MVNQNKLQGKSTKVTAKPKRTYLPTKEDAFTALCLIVEMKGGQIVLPRKLIKDVQDSVKLNLQTTYHPAEDVISFTLDKKRKSNIVIPRGIIT